VATPNQPEVFDLVTAFDAVHDHAQCGGADRGRDVIVSDNHDDTVQIWHSTGAPIGELLYLVEPSLAVAINATSGIVVASASALLMFRY
jgi:hypothetical protein